MLALAMPAERGLTSILRNVSAEIPARCAPSCGKSCAEAHIGAKNNSNTSVDLGIGIGLWLQVTNFFRRRKKKRLSKRPMFYVSLPAEAVGPSVRVLSAAK